LPKDDGGEREQLGRALSIISLRRGRAYGEVIIQVIGEEIGI